MKIDKLAEQEAKTIHIIENLKEYYSDDNPTGRYMSAKQLLKWVQEL